MTDLVHVGNNSIDQEAVLKAVGINARDPNAQALLLVCERYGLDPLLKHMVLIQGRPYVTRDGLLHVAHRSRQLDGIEVLEQSETQSHFVAKVAVYRKDMSRPFTYIGRYAKNGGNKLYGPEMAVKCAEVMGLRRAFDVALSALEERWDVPDADVQTFDHRPAEVVSLPEPPALPPAPEPQKRTRAPRKKAEPSYRDAIEQTQAQREAPPLPGEDGYEDIGSKAGPNQSRSSAVEVSETRPGENPPPPPACGGPASPDPATWQGAVKAGTRMTDLPNSFLAAVTAPGKAEPPFSDQDFDAATAELARRGAK